MAPEKEGDRTVGIERPEGFTDDEWEAYKAGAAAMMEFCGQMLLSMGGEMSAQIDAGADDRASTAGDVDGDVDVDDLPEECPDCSMELVYSMGKEEGDCPNCDLL